MNSMAVWNEYLILSYCIMLHHFIWSPIGFLAGTHLFMNAVSVTEYCNLEDYMFLMSRAQRSLYLPFIFTDVCSSENNVFFLCYMLVLFHRSIPTHILTELLLFSYLPLSSWLLWSKSITSCVALLLVSIVTLNSNLLLQNTSSSIVH